MLLSQLGSVGALAGGSLGIKSPNDMYVAMLKSETVENAMVQRYGLQQEYRTKYLSDARASFEHNAAINGSGKDGLIRISITDRDPHRAAELANGYVQQFQILSEQLAITEAAQRRLFFQKQLEQAKDQLVNAEEALKKTEHDTGLISVDSQSRALVETAASLQGRIIAQEVAVQGMQSYATGQNEQLKQAQLELDSLRGQLAKLSGIQGTSNDFIVPKGKLPDVGLEYVRKFRDVKYYETIFETLAKQFEMAKLDEAKEGALVQVVDFAVPPEKRSFPKRTQLVFLSALSGVFVGSIAVFLISWLQHAMADPETAGKLRHIRTLMRLRGSRASAL